jgi:YD repeat-containing protein
VSSHLSIFQVLKKGLLLLWGVTTFCSAYSQSSDWTRIDSQYWGGGLYQFRYHAENRLLSLTNPQLSQTLFTYDSLGQLTETLWPNGARWTFAYTESGQLHYEQGPDGRFLRFAYDSLGQLIAKHFDGKLLATYRYDQLGRLVFAQNEHATLRFRYDSQGRLLEEECNGHRLQYQYLEGGDLILQYPSGQEVNFRKSASGQEDSLWLDGKAVMLMQRRGAQPLRRVDLRSGMTSLWRYDKQGRPQHILHASHPQEEFFYSYEQGSVREQRSCDTTYFHMRYNSRGLLLEKSQQKSADQPPELIAQYEYEPDGSLRFRNLNGKRTHFQLNSLGGYQKVGPLFSQQKLKYDDRGNLASDGKRAYRYDGESRLVEVREKNGLRRTLLSYGPLGRLIHKVSPSEQVQYFYAGDRLIAEKGPSAWKAWYVWEPVTTRLLLSHWQGALWTPLLNAQGDIIGLIDEQGQVHYRFSREEKPGPGTFPYAYVHLRYHSELQLYEQAGLFYHPDLERSLQPRQPPMALPGQHGLYVSQGKQVPLFQPLPRQAGGAGVLGTGSTEEAILARWAAKVAHGNGYAFQQGKELLEVVARESREHGPIRKWVILSHGWGWPRTRGVHVNGGVYGTFWHRGLLGDIPPGRRGSDFVISREARDLADLEQELLMGRIRFASPCEIILTGCRVASTGNFVPRLARMTGCTVLASYGGSDGTRAPLFESFSKSMAERFSGQYKGYSRTWPDGRELRLGNYLRLW